MNSSKARAFKAVLAHTCITKYCQTKRCLSRRYARRRAFITKIRTIVLFRNTALDHLGLGEIFTFNETARRHVGRYQSNPVGVELVSSVNTFVGFQCYIFCAQKSRPTK